ncbi:olfactory receptor 13C4 [Embiotoca jacksoni]|uniref:olfactory receptor 13C4 n=1 Tax=Embiotoca jacksoni TaxID=100190 RepID=UPI0037048459
MSYVPKKDDVMSLRDAQTCCLTVLWLNENKTDNFCFKGSGRETFCSESAVNVLTLFCLGRSEDLSWQPRLTFLKNLILSHLVQTATLGPAVIHSLVQRRTTAFSTWCYVQFFFGCTTIFSSLFPITCMALERYLYVCHATRYLVILTNVRLRRVLAFIWVYSIAIGVIIMVLLHTEGGEVNGQVTQGLLCEPDIMKQHMGFPQASAIFRKVAGFIALLLCLLACAFSYLRMYQEARNTVVPLNVVNTSARKTVLFYCGMLFMQLQPVLRKVISDALREVDGTVAMVGVSSRSTSLLPLQREADPLGHGGGAARVPADHAHSAAVHQPAGVRTEERGGETGAGQDVPVVDRGGARRREEFETLCVRDDLRWRPLLFQSDGCGTMLFWGTAGVQFCSHCTCILDLFSKNIAFPITSMPTIVKYTSP